MTCNQNCDQGRQCECAKNDTPRTEEIMRMHRECMHKLATPANERVLKASVSALERELAEQCRLLAMGSEREARLMAQVEEERAKVAKLREALCQIRHSMHQAMIPGNDSRREIRLSGETADAALKEGA